MFCWCELFTERFIVVAVQGEATLRGCRLVKMHYDVIVALQISLHH